MTYTYGMRNNPVIGGGLGGLPRRKITDAVCEEPDIYPNFTIHGTSIFQSTAYATGLLENGTSYLLETTTKIKIIDEIKGGNRDISFTSYPFTNTDEGSLFHIWGTQYVLQFTGDKTRLFRVDDWEFSSIAFTYIKDVSGFNNDGSPKCCYFKKLDDGIFHFILRDTDYQVKSYIVQVADNDLTVLSDYSLNSGIDKYCSIIPFDDTTIYYIYGDNDYIYVKCLYVEDFSTQIVAQQGAGDLTSIKVDGITSKGILYNGKEWSVDKESQTISQTTFVYETLNQGPETLYAGEVQACSTEFIVSKNRITFPGINTDNMYIGTTSLGAGGLIRHSDFYDKSILLIDSTNKKLLTRIQ